MSSCCGETFKSRRGKEEMGFKIHRTVYLCVIGMLITVNMVFIPEVIWFIYPMTGWGIGLTVHYLNVRELSRDSEK